MSSTRTLIISRIALTALAAAALSACGTTASRGTGEFSALPTEQFPLATTTEPTGVQLAPHTYGLSPNQAKALQDLAADWRANGEGLILIEAPSCACDDGAMTAYDAREALVAYGAPASSIRMIGYEADVAAPIRVSFQKVQAQTYDCAREWDDVTRSGDNQPRSNFGCAVNSNLAAMIEQPSDINRPRETDPFDAGRRQVVLELYREGQPTGATRNDDADATISNVLN